MRFIRLFHKLTLILVLVSTFQLNAKEVDDYKISSDDEISITVFNEPDLSIKSVKISGNGTVSMSLLGQVNIAGLTVVEAEKKISDLLLDGYLKKPSVVIHIVEYRPFYINGQVKNPGSYPYRKDLTIQKAVTIAGGFTERASKSMIFVVTEKDKKQMKSVALDAKVNPGDVITVNESYF